MHFRIAYQFANPRQGMVCARERESPAHLEAACRLQWGRGHGGDALNAYNWYYVKLLARTHAANLTSWAT
jgi:hypothetical protein